MCQLIQLIFPVSDPARGKCRDTASAAPSSDEDDDPAPQRRRLHDRIRENHEIYSTFNHDVKAATNAERMWTAGRHFEY